MLGGIAVVDAISYEMHVNQQIEKKIYGAI